MNDATTTTTNTLSTVAVPPTPPEAHQRAVEEQGRGSGFSATYCIHDNKLRLRAEGRLDAELYARVTACGFKWAPREKIFIAPSWTPNAEDLLLVLCDEIEDEDMSLKERAEARAERFEIYRERRAEEADAAHRYVSGIAGRMEPGQPILVGHHSERRARRDKERIDNGMRKAVQKWDDAQYWMRRAVATKRHADFKERTDVRARRIYRLEADQRKFERNFAEAARAFRLWSLVPRFEWDEQSAVAVKIAGSAVGGISITHRDDYGISLHRLLTSEGQRMHGDTAWRLAVDQLATTIEFNARWVRHFTNRIAFERHMLDDSGGLPADKYDIQVGGRVLIRSQWFSVTRVNRKAGGICSVSIKAKYVPVRGIEEVQGYEPPTEKALAAAKAASTLPPICNYPGEGFHSMTSAEWKAMHKDYKGTRELGQEAIRSQPGSGRPDIRNAEKASLVGLHRVRVAVVVRAGLCPVYVTDLKRKDPPPAVANTTPAPAVQEPEPDARAAKAMDEQRALIASRREEVEDAFVVMREKLRAGGAQAVVAPQLFSTADAIAARVIDAAEIPLGASVLEPQAGLGALLRAMPGLLPFGTRRQTWGGRVVAVEINAALAVALRDAGIAHQVHCANFLECTPQLLGLFDRIVMNPPFSFWADIRHIEHARTFLAPGGRLVAICANGPRQRETLKPAAIASGGFYEALPEGAFAHVGTNISTALLAINA